MKVAINLWPHLSHLHDEITDELKKEFVIDQIEDYLFFDNFKEVFYLINRIDNASGDEELGSIRQNVIWKYEQMKNNLPLIRVLYAEIGEPEYRPRGDGNDISQVVERFKRRYREKYGTHIPDYNIDNDLIIHVADNEKQTILIRKLLDKMILYKMTLDLNKYFKLIKNLSYFLVKVDTPYVPKDFPSRYAISKDLDIIISAEDYPKIKEITRKFSDSYPEFERLWINEPSGFRLRFEKFGKLHFQLDIQHSPEEVTNTEEYYKQHIIKNEYKTLPDNYEKIFRQHAYNKNNYKTWHLEWLKKHE